MGSKRPDYKQVARAVAAQHNALGCSMVDVKEGRCLPREGCVLFGTSSAQAAVVPRKEITAREVREFLWQWRKRRELRRGTAVVWSVYDEGVSTVGLASWVKREVADRLAGRGDLVDLDLELGDGEASQAAQEAD